MISILFYVTVKAPIPTIPPQGSTEELSSTSSWASPTEGTALTVNPTLSSTEAEENRTGTVVTSTDSRSNRTGQSRVPQFHMFSIRSE